MDKKGRTLIFLVLFGVVGGLFAVGLVSSVGTQFHPPSQISPQGSGSGLDADKVDGLHAADLLASGSGGALDDVITLYGTSTCPTGAKKLLNGSLAAFSAFAIWSNPVEPAVNVFACIGNGNTTLTATTVANVSFNINWGFASHKANTFDSSNEGLLCVICRLNSTF